MKSRKTTPQFVSPAKLAHLATRTWAQTHAHRLKVIIPTLYTKKSKLYRKERKRKKRKPTSQVVVQENMRLFRP